MATKFFKHVSVKECGQAKADKKIGLCNRTGHKVAVDEEGHFVPPHGHAIIDKSNKILESMVERGLIAINETMIDEPPQKSKSDKSSKNKDETVEVAADSEIFEEVPPAGVSTEEEQF